MTEEQVAEYKKLVDSVVTQISSFEANLNEFPNDSKPEYVPATVTVSAIDARESFEQLSTKDQLYAYWLSRASWAGSKINFFQRSYESPALFYLFGKVFMLDTMETLKANLMSTEVGGEESEWSMITAYVAAFLMNKGNYKGFGDNKFVPEISKEKMYKWIQASTFYKQNESLANMLWNENKFELYEYRKPYSVLGFPDNNGRTGYFSSNCSEADATFIAKFTNSIKLLVENTFLLKMNDKFYQILVVSSGYNKHVQESKFYEFEGVTIEIQYGFLGSFMNEVVDSMKQAGLYNSNENQKKMVDAYVGHFTDGDLDKHKESQRWWINDKGPVIETNIGFVETYLDPQGVRAEWEGFVAAVDKKQS